MRQMLARKALQQSVADTLPQKLALAMAKSNRIMGEDIIREAEYMLPQSGNTHAFLTALATADNPVDFPSTAVTALLDTLDCNENE